MAFIAVAGGALFGGGAFGSLAFNAVLGLGMMGLSWWLQSQQHTQGPRKEDLEVSDQPIGTPVQLHYGSNAIFATYIWIKDNKVIEKKKTERAGKGGPKVTTFSYFLTAALIIADNEQTAFAKWWINDKVIFNNTGDGDEDELVEIKGLTYEFYQGTLTQLPDPVMEASLGVGNVPAYRGASYIRVTELALEEVGNVPPQMRFLMIQGGTTVNTIGGARTGTAINFNGVFDKSNESFWYTYNPPTMSKWDMKLTTPTLITSQTFIAAATIGDFEVDSWDRLYFPEAPNSLGPIGIYDTNTLTRIGEIPTLSSNTVPKISYSTGPDNQETILYSTSTAEPGGPSLWMALEPDPITGVIAISTVIHGIAIEGAIRFRVGSVVWAIEDNLVAATIDISRWGDLQPESHTKDAYSLADDGFGIMYGGGYYPDDHTVVLWGLTGDVGTKEFQVAKYDADFMMNPTLLQTVVVPMADFFAGTPDGLQPNGQQNLKEGYIVIGDGVNEAHIFNLATMTDSICQGTNMGDYAHGRWLPSRQAFMGSQSSGAFTNETRLIRCGFTDKVLVSIKEIFDNWNPRVGMPASRIDTTDLASEFICGYTWKSNSSIGEGFSDIMSVYGIDIADLGDKYKFLLRGSQTPIVIDPDDLGADEGSEPADVDLKIELKEGYEVPKTMHLKHWDPDAEYETSIQEAFRHSAVISSRDIVEVTTRMVMLVDQAAEKIGDMFRATWRARVTFECFLPQRYRQYAPGDVFQVTYDGLLYEFMVDEITFDDSVITVKGTGEDVTDWGLTATGQSTLVRIGQVVNLSIPRLHLLDINAVRDTEADFKHYLAHHAKTPSLSYSGCSVQKGNAQDLLTDWLGFNNPVVHGSILNPPNQIPFPELPDRGSQLRVFIHPDQGFVPAAAVDLEAVQNDIELNPMLLLVTADDGTPEVEVLQYASVTSEASDVWLFEDLIRGRRGSEHLIPNSLSAFIALFPTSTNMYREGVASEVGTTRYYQAITFGDILPSTNPIAAFANSSKALRPYDPYDLTGSRPSTDLVIDWLRRAIVAGQWEEGVEMPLEFTQEEYNVNIYVDSTKAVLLRLANVIGVSTYTYTLTNYNADAAASESVVPAVFVSVAQVGDDFGDGVATEGTL